MSYIPVQKESLPWCLIALQFFVIAHLSLVIAVVGVNLDIFSPHLAIFAFIASSFSAGGLAYEVLRTFPIGIRWEPIRTPPYTKIGIGLLVVLFGINTIGVLFTEFAKSVLKQQHLIGIVAGYWVSVVLIGIGGAVRSNRFDRINEGDSISGALLSNKKEVKIAAVVLVPLAGIVGSLVSIGIGVGSFFGMIGLLDFYISVNPEM